MTIAKPRLRRDCKVACHPSANRPRRVRNLRPGGRGLLLPPPASAASGAEGGAQRRVGGASAHSIQRWFIRQPPPRHIDRCALDAPPSPLLAALAGDKKPRRVVRDSNLKPPRHTFSPRVTDVPELCLKSLAL